jgi:LuxR family maltose regulon positive regulatory protein
MKKTSAGNTGDPDLDDAALLNRGIAVLWRGDQAQSQSCLTHALDLARSEGLDHAALECQVHLAALAAGRSDPMLMVEHAVRAIEFATERGWQTRPSCALAYTLLGVQAYQRFDDARARQLSSLAVQVLNRCTDPTTVLATLTLDAVVTFDHAEDPHAVVADLWRQWHTFQDLRIAPSLVAYMAPTAQRMALRTGEHQWAAELDKRIEAVLGPCGEHSLLQAVLQANRARAPQARKLLQPIVSGERHAIVAYTVVDAWLLEATLADRVGHAREAHHGICQALVVAEPLGAIRPFFNAGKPIRDLLVELPSMWTIEEIADSLFVSVNTVKTHLRGIYRKLGVNHRRDAVVVARQRGLI